jgi:hypothetical protein
MENHTVENRTTEGTSSHTAARIDDCTADRTVEVAVQDPSVCAGSARNAECRMDMRTVYPTDQEYQ